MTDYQKYVDEIQQLAKSVEESVADAKTDWDRKKALKAFFRDAKALRASFLREADRINYQLIPSTRVDKVGQHIPDWDALIANATCEEEAEYLKGLQEKMHGLGFAYNMIYVTRQKCGHFEIFQTPCNVHYPLDENLKQAREHAETHACTACTCGWPKHRNTETGGEAQ